jgi:hypothetical protein
MKREDKTEPLKMFFTDRSHGTMSYFHEASHGVVTENRLRIATDCGFSAFEKIKNDIVGHGFAPKLMQKAGDSAIWDKPAFFFFLKSYPQAKFHLYCLFFGKSVY